MKKKSWLWAFIVISYLLVCGSGALLKYRYLDPQGLYQDMNVVEITMRCLTDPELRRAVWHGNEEPDLQSPSATTEPTETTTEVPTEPAETVTEVPTEPTETVTEAPTEPEPLTPMDDAWFDDVLFIGDSRTVGLRDLARSGRADYFCTVGLTVFEAMKVEASDVSFEEQKLGTLLSSRSYGKIIITLGINECGYNLNTLLEAYQKLIDEIKALQPNAKIILQSIMMVGRKKAAQASYFQISNLRKVNEGIQSLTDGSSVFFIDVNDKFTDSEGYLLDEMSSDGCHLYGKYDVEWEKWIRAAVTDLQI